MATEQQAIPTEVQKELDEAGKALAIAQDLKIESPEQFDQAGENLKNIIAKRKELTMTRLNLTRPIDDSKRRIMGFFSGPIGALEKAEAYYRRGRTAYLADQEAKRRKAEAEAQERARKEQERINKQALRAEDKGQTEKAEALREQADQVHTPSVAVAAPKTAGISTRSTWQAEVVDKAAFIQAVVDGKVPDVLLLIDMKALNAQARALKKGLNYPGVKVIENKTEAVRT